MNLMRFYKAKCTVMERNSLKAAEKYLGFLVDEKFGMNQQCNPAVPEANRILN